MVYSIIVVVPVVVKYSLGNYNLTDPVIFEQYMNDVMQPILDATMLLTIISGVLTIGIIWLIFVCRKKKVTKELCLRKISGGTAASVILMGFIGGSRSFGDTGRGIRTKGKNDGNDGTVVGAALSAMDSAVE